MSRVHWKVCGITNSRDAAAAIDAGADALGFVFWPPSLRAVETALAGRIAATVPGAVTKVGVFVNASPDEIVRTVERAGLDAVQLSGDEPPEACAALPVPCWKALRWAPGTTPRDAEESAGHYPDCTLLIDAAIRGEYGGTGERADWQLAARLAARRRVVLAGGLDAGNVAAAIAQVRPWGVDVSSGVEIEPGRKDHDELRRFASALEGCR